MISGEFSASAKGGVSSQRLGFFQLAVENAFRSWRNSQVSVLAEQMVVTQAREEVVRSHTDVRAIEKLRERAVERYDADCAREEMGLLDEVAGRTRSLAERLSKLPGEREGSRP
ncbi:MAG: flagellar FliJ family protein [Myxococcales bacterium]|nr:flagellar FliJ family protein [Myxococcales bacterium]